MLGAHFCTVCGSSVPGGAAPLRTATAPQFTDADLAGIDQNFDELFVSEDSAQKPLSPEALRQKAQELLKPIRSFMIELEIGSVPIQGVEECRAAIERLRALDPNPTSALDELAGAFARFNAGGAIEERAILRRAYTALLEHLQMDPRRSIPAEAEFSGPEEPLNEEARSERAMDTDGRPKVKHTVVEEGSRFKGSLASDCPVDVRGRIDGEIETPALTVSASGAVHGEAKVASLRSEGELSGTFDADTVELAGKVKDNTVIRAHKIALRLASENGKLEIVFGEQVQSTSASASASGLGSDSTTLSTSTPDAEQVMSAAIARTDDAEQSADAASNNDGWQKNRRRSRGNRHSDPPPAE